MSSMDEKLTVENVNVLGYTTRVKKAMYDAMKEAIWKVLPSVAPGWDTYICHACAHTSERRRAS